MLHVCESIAQLSTAATAPCPSEGTNTAAYSSAMTMGPALSTPTSSYGLTLLIDEVLDLQVRPGTRAHNPSARGSRGTNRPGSSIAAFLLLHQAQTT
jgi:hypothetical protein